MGNYVEVQLTVHALRKTVLRQVMSNNLVANLGFSTCWWVGKVVGSLIGTSASAELGTVVLGLGIAACCVAKGNVFGTDISVVVVCGVIWNI